MPPLLEDPRIRQTWNNISHNAETATESAAAGIWTFTHDYINPCFASLGERWELCTAGCCTETEEQARRRRERERGRARGRAEYSFDFYDDWDEEETAGGSSLLGWGNDELDRLLAGSGSRGKGGNEQPSGRKRGMSYGTGKAGPRRKHTIDGLPDPTVIPSTNTFGFLQRLPFKFGGTLRYKPSAADLQEHPGTRREVEPGAEEEGEPLIDDDERSSDGEGDAVFGHRRKRSGTTGSGETSDSFRSRGDLFPSDGEDDAVPLGDEFAMALERRGTGLSMDDHSSGRTKGSKGKRVSSSRQLSRTVSRTTQSSGTRPTLKTRTSSTSGGAGTMSPPDDLPEMPSLNDLQREEERLRQQEDEEVERKRDAAAKLAARRGLSISLDEAPQIKQEPVEDEEATEVAVPTSVEEEVAAKIASPAEPPSREGGFVPARLPMF